MPVLARVSVVTVTIQRRFHEGSIRVPAPWSDDTLNVLKAPDHEGHNLVISREPLPTGVDVPTHLEAQRAVIATTLAEFSESGRHAVTIHGQACTLLEYNWRSPEGPMFQANLMRSVGDTMVSFTFTSARPFTNHQRGEIMSVLTSFTPAPEMEAPARP